jgi:hypothetical protein
MGDPEGQGVLATQPPPGVGPAIWTSGAGCARLMERGREAHKSVRVKAADRDHRAEMTGSSPSLTDGGAREHEPFGRVERRWQHRRRVAQRQGLPTPIRPVSCHKVLTGLEHGCVKPCESQGDSLSVRVSMGLGHRIV